MNVDYLHNNLKEQLKLLSHTRLGIRDIAALMVIAWAIIPILSENAVFRGLAILGAIVFLFSIYISKFKHIITYTNAAIILTIMLFLIIVLGEKQFYFAFSRALNLFFFVTILIISKYYYTSDIRKLCFFTFLIIIIFAVVAVISIVALRSNPFVLRRASGLTIRTGIDRFAGSYGFAYGCVFLESFLVYNFKNHFWSRNNRVIEIVLIVLFGFLIIDSGYTTAIILTIVGVISAFIVDKSPTKTVLFATIIVIALSIIIPQALSYIIHNYDLPLVYEQKIIMLSDMTASDGNISYSDSTRGQLLIKSLKAIFHYPLLGSVILTGEMESGGHQTLLDVLANYGIIYAAFYYYVIVYGLFNQMNEDKAARLLFLILVIFLGFTNTYDFGTFIIPAFVGPYVSLNRNRP